MTQQEVEASCQMGGEAFISHSTHFDWCVYHISQPLRGPAPTLGWTLAAAQAMDEIDPQLDVPTLVLSMTEDPYVVPSVNAEICSQMPDCTLEEFTSDPEQGIYWSHSLLADAHAYIPMTMVRDFISELIGCRGPGRPPPCAGRAVRRLGRTRRGLRHLQGHSATRQRASRLP